jgi:hypothetical protein
VQSGLKFKVKRESAHSKSWSNLFKCFLSQSRSRLCYWINSCDFSHVYKIIIGDSKYQLNVYFRNNKFTSVLYIVHGPIKQKEENKEVYKVIAGPTKFPNIQPEIFFFLLFFFQTSLFIKQINGSTRLTDLGLSDPKDSNMNSLKKIIRFIYRFISNKILKI